MDYAGEEDEREVVKDTSSSEPMQYTTLSREAKQPLVIVPSTNTFPLDAKKFQSRFDQWMKNRSGRS